MLFDEFEMGQSNKKRQCIEMVGAKPTGVQLCRQIKTEIHVGHANGTVFNAQTLAAMPLLCKLVQPLGVGNSSTKFSFIDFGGADNDEWEEEIDENKIVGEEQQNHFRAAPTNHQTTTMRHWSNIEYRIVGNRYVPVETSMCTNYANLPKGIVYQLHMMHIMNKHREVDLKMYSEINDCVRYHATEKTSILKPQECILERNW